MLTFTRPWTRRPLLWYFPDMPGPAIPQFHLYGESESFADPGFVHIETIESRSRRNDWEISPHRHQRMDQLLILRSGGVTVRIDAAEEWREGPLAIYVPAMTVHGFVFDAEVDGDVLSFSADLGRSVLPAHYPAPLFPGQPLVQPLDPLQIAAINPLLEQLGLECSGHDSGRIAAASWIVALILLQVERARGVWRRRSCCSGKRSAAALSRAGRWAFRRTAAHILLCRPDGRYRKDPDPHVPQPVRLLAQTVSAPPPAAGGAAAADLWIGNGGADCG